MGNDVDEVVLNVLLTEVDPATALAGSVIDKPQPKRAPKRFWFDVGLVIGLVLVILWWLL